MTSPSVYKNNIGLFNVISTDEYNRYYIVYATEFVGGSEFLIIIIIILFY